MASEQRPGAAPGDPAPDATLTDRHGARLRLSELWAASPLVLVFFPLAFSATCTRELAALQGAAASFSARRVRVVGVSVDSHASLAAFADAEGLDLPLLSDFWPHGEVARAYDAFDERKGWARRVTVSVDRSGVVRDRFSSGPGEERPLAAYRASVAALGDPGST